MIENIEEKIMKVYHTATQEDYDALMIELEEKGCEWKNGIKLTHLDNFKKYDKDTYIYNRYGAISFSGVEYFKEYHGDEPLIEYKAKGDKQMLNTECKQCHEKWHHDNAKYCSMCGKKLVEEPEFRVGDYVVEQNGDVISKIGEVINGDFWGPYYKKAINFFGNFGAFIRDKDIERYATPEEIAEYEVALQFHKHGRKPFEVRQGDIISYNESDKFIVDYEDIEPEFETFDKEKFIRGDLTFVKTAEEVNEWLENK